MTEAELAALKKEAEEEAAAYLKGASKKTETTVGQKNAVPEGERYVLPKETVDMYAKLRDMERKQTASETDKNFEPSVGTAAGLGAAAGALAQYKGATLGNGILGPGENVFTAPAVVSAPVLTPTPAPVAAPKPNLVDIKIAELTAQQRLADETLNANLRRITGDPKANYAGFSEEQINRLFSGGNTDTLGTPGTSRELTHNYETSRIADVNKLNRERLGGIGLDPRIPVEQAGPLVTLANSRIAVSPQTAIGLYSEQQAKAAAEAERLRQEHARQTQLNQSTLAALNAKKDADAAAAERTAANKALADQEAAIRAHSIAARGQQREALKSGMKKVGMGMLGGLEVGPQALNMYKEYAAGRTPDWTEKASLAGGLASMFGKPVLGALGQAAQIPYLVKHREDIARAMRMGEVMPDTMRMMLGAGEAEEPAFSALQKP